MDAAIGALDEKFCIAVACQSKSKNAFAVCFLQHDEWDICHNHDVLFSCNPAAKLQQTIFKS